MAVRTPPWLDRGAYPFADRWLDLPAGRMHYVDEGRGEPVLFVHGTPTWSFEWRHLVRDLAATHRCVAPDHLGFGLSERPRDFGYGPADHARALADFVERLGLPPFTLAVHDYGGPIGLPLALDRPEQVRRLVLVNTWMWSLADDADIAGKARLAASPLGRLLYTALNFSPRVLLRTAWIDRRRLTRDVHRHYLAPFPDWASRERVLWTLARALLGASPYYDGLWQRRDRLLGRPALIVWGMRDPAFRPQHLRRWIDLFGDRATVLRLDGVGHWPQEEAPELVIPALRAFLEAAAPPGPPSTRAAGRA